MRHRSSRRALAALVVGALSLLAACTPGAAANEEGPTIALLLPDAKTARWEQIDRPGIAAVVAEHCASCTFLHANAQQDALTQLEQAQSFLARGADVLVLTAVDGASALSIVTEASERGVPVIAYDRFLDSPDVAFYVSFDSERIGRIQALGLLEGLAAQGFVPSPGDDRGILVLGGASTDPNSAQLARGRAPVIDGAGLRVLATYDVPDWSPDKAQDWVADQVARFSDRIVGVYAANDAMAAGATSAMRAAALRPLPITVGQDAELAAVRRILTGDQHMTVYKDIREQARTAGELAVRLAQGENPAAEHTLDRVPAVLLTPLAVARGDIAATILGRGVFTVDEICVEPYVQACEDAGLQSRSRP